MREILKTIEIGVEALCAVSSGLLCDGVKVSFFGD